MNETAFNDAFAAVAGYSPFPWQWELYRRFISDRQDNIPSSCNLPTGLGKTSVIHIWLLALATAPQKVPRQLVYVVNRRTVVDQSTDEAVKMRDRLIGAFGPPTETQIKTAQTLANLSADSTGGPLAISTLRGQFADNREWSADPSRPAIICGTVDMIGSRLLFSGYRCGFKTKPLHAGFLGQDALLVHDEAHLEPAFQHLIEAIQCEQHGRRLDEFGKCVIDAKRTPDFRPFRVMELTATSRGDGDVFELTKAEKEEAPAEIPNPPTQPIHHVWRRIHAKKSLPFYKIGDEKKELVPKLVELALVHQKSDEKPAVLVFVRTVESVNNVVAGLKKAKVLDSNILTLTGTMRGYERDRMATESGVFARFAKSSPAPQQMGTVYLICTSAGEVGVDLSADHMVCDLSTYDSMAQRFGRVNRYGNGDARIDVVHPATFDTKDKPFEAARERTIELLGKLRLRADGLRDASPASLGELLERAIQEGCGDGNSVDRTKAIREYVRAVFAPAPAILPVTDILFDAWALTTIKGKLPGRPPVEEYLHGVEEKEQYNTTFAWREEVALLADVARETLGDLLDEFPLKPHETLSIPTFGKRSAFDQLEAIAEREVESKPHPVWVIEPDGELTVYPSLKVLLKKNGKDYAILLAARTVVLPPKAGGLTTTGMLDGKMPHSDTINYDVAGTPPPKVDPLVRLKRVHREEEETFVPVAQTDGWPADLNPESLPKSVKPVLRIDLDRETDDDELAPARSNTSSFVNSRHSQVAPITEPLHVVVEYVIVRKLKAQTAKAAPEWPSLDGHLDGVRKYADAICAALKLDPKITEAVRLAATYHDLGKSRTVWQRGAGNSPTNSAVAKTLHGRAPENLNRFRHELGSMVDAVASPEFADKFNALDGDQRELVLHLIATHHGRGRPHFPAQEAFDNDRPDALVAAVAGEAPGRFAKLQRKYGRWGLAYLESLLRAADALESRRIEATPLADSVPGKWPQRPQTLLPYISPPLPTPSMTVAVDPTNPGQFFACCGLLELADRVWSGAEGWFAEGGREFCIAGGGTLKELLASAQKIQFSGNAEDEKEDSEEDDDDHEEPTVVSPLEIVTPITLRLDWWKDINLKPWAGSMSARNIALAMCRAIDPDHIDPLNQSQVVPEVKEIVKPTKSGKPPKAKPKEPFHLDGRRGANALGRDIGFIHDTLKKRWKTPMFAHPVVEFFALIGLQRSRPQPTDKVRVYDYFTWTRAWRCQVTVLPAAVCGLLGDPDARRYRFKNAFRTGKKRHKAFMPATPLAIGENP
jgi:CRISPR-associated endonuclease/helicase Cas3